MFNFTMRRIIPCFIIAVLLPVFFEACASSNVIIEEDLSPAQLIQRAQEASDRNRYRLALQYYEALLERNRHNIDLVITAEYEIAFIYYKRGMFTQAREGFNGVLEYYEGPDSIWLPQHFKRLSEIVLQRIDEREENMR